MTQAIEGFSVSGESYVGGLVGRNYGTLSGCHANGSVFGDSLVGGLVGLNDYGVITKCSAAGTVLGATNFVGGLAGINYGLITLSYADSHVTGQYRVGGLVGENWWQGTGIENCYAMGLVTGDLDVGGLVGASENRIIASYSTGEVVGNENVGGLLGYQWLLPAPQACFWDMETSGVSGSVGGKGLTTDQMKSVAYYQNAGWSNSDWVMTEGQYPRLAWENTGDPPIPEPEPIPLTGNGTLLSPYIISTPEELALLSWHTSVLDKHIVLAADLDCSATELWPIGDLGAFTGKFDGQQHVIHNLTLNFPAQSGVGLFGWAGENAEIKNVSLSQASITGHHFVGALIGWSRATIRNCSVVGNINGYKSVGGLVGDLRYNANAMEKCFSSGSVSGTRHIGGLVGNTEDAGITQCFATTRVSGYDRVGGLVGTLNRDHLSQSYASGKVSGDWNVGGLLGANWYGIVSKCYSIGEVEMTGSGWIGGLVGYNRQAHADVCGITTSFWDVQTSKQSGSSGGMGLTTAQMKTRSCYENAGWQDTEWVMAEGAYPRLAWENTGAPPLAASAPLPLPGSGTESDPYRIAAAADLAVLAWYSDALTAHISLEDDLDCAHIEFLPIGTLGMFNGVFDAKGHTIINVTINRPRSDSVGFFAEIGPLGVVRNVNLNNVTVTGRRMAGCLAGLNWGLVESCSVIGTLTAQKHVGGIVGGNLRVGTIELTQFDGTVFGDVSVGGMAGFNSGDIQTSCSAGSIWGDGGGLVGWNDGSVSFCVSSAWINSNDQAGGLISHVEAGQISYSFATGNVTGDWRAGGLVGYNHAGVITQCYARGTVLSNKETGGLVGFNNSEVSQCYAKGDVEGGEVAGGLIGGNTGMVSKCYSIGAVSGDSFIGGLVGWNDGGNISASYWDTQTSGRSASAGGTGRNTAAMTLPYAENTYIGWNFVDIWLEDVEWHNQGYPSLKNNPSLVGRLVVIIEPEEARNAGAQWSMDEGATWHESGHELTLETGDYEITFSVLEHWHTPVNAQVAVSNNETTHYSDAYTQHAGNLVVVIEPQCARDAGAQWRVDNGEWQDSGDILSGLVVGNHTISFKPLSGWNTPADQVATILLDNTTNAFADYQDIEAPVMTLLGHAEVTVPCGSAYADAGVTAHDNCDGDLTGEVEINHPVDIRTPGVYIITYNVSDSAENTAVELTRSVTVVDNNPPTITLEGELSAAAECGQAYHDPGATAWDDCDGDLTNAIVIDNSVDTSSPGVYTVTYTVSDDMGHVAEPITRTVTVADTAAPILALEGPDEIAAECGYAYHDSGATAWDSCEGDLTASVTVESSVNTDVLGVYQVVFSVADGSDNEAETVARVVTVADTESPLMTLGDWPDDMVIDDAGYARIECGDVFIEPDGFMGWDACAGDLGMPQSALETDTKGVLAWAWALNEQEEPLWMVDEKSRTPLAYAYDEFSLVPGVYLLVYVAWDDMGNSYPALDDFGLPSIFDDQGNLDIRDENGHVVFDFIRLVRVVDILQPNISLIGAPEIILDCGADFQAPGAVAWDACDGDITAAIEIDNPVDVHANGIYSITYSVLDTAGNHNTIVRTIRVENCEEGEPESQAAILLIGSAAMTVECGTDFVDPGVIAVDDDGMTPLDTTVTGSVNTSSVGMYTLVYRAHSTRGISLQLQRTVVVADTLKPSITLEGMASVAIECGAFYVDAGATAWDDCDGDLTNAIVIDNSVDTSTPGSYAVTYMVMDGAENITTISRSVRVEPCEEGEPASMATLTLQGDAIINVECGGVFNDPGATAMDDDGATPLDVTMTGEVNTTLVGVHMLTYHTTSTMGRELTVTRTVTVSDTTTPDIVLNGDSTVTVECGADYRDAGATAQDVCDGDLTDQIVISNSVNTSVPAVYTVRYRVTDSASLATETIRTVTVTGPCALSGIVRDDISAALLSEVGVTLYLHQTDIVVNTMNTSGDGFFYFEIGDTNLQYDLHFEKDGHEPLRLGGLRAPQALEVWMSPTASALPAPRGLTASVTTGQVLLRWEAVIDAALTGYHVYRDGIRFTEAPVTMPRYLDQAVEAGATYEYQVRSVDATGRESALSAPVTVTILLGLWLSEASGHPGDVLLTTLNVTNARDVEVTDAAGITITLDYDVTAVESVTADAGALLRRLNATTTDNGEGLLTLSVLNPSAPIRLSGEGKLFDLYFTLRDDAQEGCIPITASQMAFFDAIGAAIPAVLLGTPELCVGQRLVLGDLDGDGMVTTGDTVLAMLIATLQITPTEYQRKVGDINGDGRLDSADAVLIHRLASNFRMSPRSDEETLADLLTPGAPVLVALPIVEAAPGAIVTLPLDIQPAAGLAGADFVIAQDPRLLVGDGPVTFPGLPSVFETSVNRQPRGFRIAISAADAIVDTPETPMLMLRFVVSPEVSVGSVLPVMMANASLKGQYGEDFDWYADIRVISGAVHVIDDIEGEGNYEGEGEGESIEGEIEGEGDQGCCGGCRDKDAKSIVYWLGDWLLVGLALLILSAIASTRPTIAR